MKTERKINMGSYSFRGFPSIIISKNFRGEHFLDVEEGAGFDSKPNLLIGNQTQTIVLDGVAGRKYRIKSILLTTETNNGEIKLYRESGDVLILPAYIGQGRGTVSGNFNLLLDEGEGLYVTTSGVGAGEEVFVGITYTENKID